MTEIPKSLPTDPQALTAHWLTQVLREQNVIAETPVEAIQVHSMSERAGLPDR